MARTMFKPMVLGLFAVALATAPVLAKPLHLPVSAASISTDPLTGGNTLEIAFKNDAAQAFADFTNRHIGHRIDVRIDGELITSPVIQSAIPGGTVVLTGDFSAAELEGLAARLLAGDAEIELSRSAEQ